MKFRYYITDLFDGCIKGTNDGTAAKDYAACDDYFVVDAETGEQLLGSLDSLDIINIKEF